MNLLSSLLKYTADQIAALRSKDSSHDGRLSEAETSLSTLESRIETAISAVTTDTEVTDIRVGNDGVTYGTAGTSVRTQFSDLQANVGRLAKLVEFHGENLEWEAGGINSSTGKAASSIYTLRTKAVLFNGMILFTGATSPYDRAVFVYCYDKKGEYIERFGLTGRTSLLALSDNTAFVRFVYGFTTASGTNVEAYGRDNLISEWSADIYSGLVEYIGGQGEIASGDLNNYTENGIYVMSNAGASVVAHTPSNLGGILMVINPKKNVKVLYQMYMQNDNELFVRFKSSSAWMDWFSVVGRQRAIQSGTNIDDVLVHGAYGITNTVVPTLLNYPANGGGVLVVNTPMPTGYPKVQILYAYDGRVYTRIRQTTRYTEWSNATNAVCDTSKEARIISSSLRKLFVESVAVYSTLPKENGEAGVLEYYNQNDVVKGVIYSSAWREGNDVYWNKTLETYYSALANPASILYTDDITDMGIYNAHAVWGGVCSTFVSYFLNFPYYTTTASLASTLVDKEMDSLDEIEVGDILLKDGHIAMISQVYTSDKGAITSVDVSEQTMPRFETTNVPFDSLESYLDRYGYKVKQNTFGKPRTLGNTEYASDIIFEYGNNTYVDISSIADMWFYIPDGSTVYYKKDDAESYTSIALSGVPTNTVNGVTVYNLTSIFDTVGDYLLTTDVDNSKQCLIKVINIGTATIADGVLTLSGYQNCTPKQYYMVNLVEGESSVKEFDPPEGYHTTFPNKHHYIESDDVIIEDIPSSGKYKLCIDYETGVGYKRILSANIGV